MISRFKRLKTCIMTVGNKGSENCLIYIAITKNKKESVSHLRKQLQFLHCLVKSQGTNNIPSTLANYTDYVWRDPAAVLNLYLPMRLHPMTRGAVNNIILRYKPSKEQLYFKELEKNEEGQVEEEQEEEEDQEYLYYYALVLMKNTVVTIFKNNPDISITPADVNIIINHTHGHEIYRKEKMKEE